ncbi:Uma2 family endonuclease [Dulcicalothrix desertica]|uniref:Uma2 family endonuclease n=1 Tax=Dulcicalothrix desertica TaxID=32056 RepID=UPI00119C2CC2|nr:Uma2 family endonuclease [Dulcicalothrix desertica]TWH51312.1 Uma2 family endonuclease [Dulcicalothrix desertica PCC 7102]
MTTFSNQLNAEIIYPYSDGKPMAESDPARNYLFYCVNALDIYFQNRTDVYVSGNLFIYYIQGDPGAVIAPDVFVVFGIRKKERLSYKLWEENNKAPDFVIEITSESTQEEDETTKPSKYASLGVTEYFQYDPEEQYLNPNLKGFRLNSSNTYEPIQRDILPDGSFSIHSSVLNLDLRLIYDELRFFDPQTGDMLLSPKESEKGRLEAKQKELQAEQARIKAEQEKDQAEQARIKAEQEKSQAEQARIKAEQKKFQAEQARLEAEESRNGAIPELLAMGLSVEQVASALKLPVEQVRRLIKE